MTTVIPFNKGARIDITQCEPGLIMLVDGTLAWLKADGTTEPVPATGGSQPVVTAHKLPFAFDTPGLLDGAPLYTPTPGEILYDGWIEQVTSWDGTSPNADLGMFTLPGPPTGLFEYSGVGRISLGSSQDESLGVGIYAQRLGYGAYSFTFITDDPVCICVTQTGVPGESVKAFLNTPTNLSGLIPITVVAGVNDEFVWTGEGGLGTPETFTIAPGTYASIPAAGAAIAAAIGESAEAFSTLVDVTTDFNFDIVITAKIAGSAANGDTLGPGANDGSSDFGYTDPPSQILLNGVDMDPGSTMGESNLILVTMVLPD